MSDERELQVFINGVYAGSVPTPVTVPKTREDVEALKANWRADPCWDIEDTEGFDDFYGELLLYRHEWEARWAAETEKRIAAYAARNGIGDLKLAALIQRMEQRIAALEGTDGEGVS